LALAASVVRQTAVASVVSFDLVLMPSSLV
jgi:hypothetical protein